MRVITGEARGRRLKTLEGLSVRPTIERVKEAIFSIVQFDVAGSSFLDLFAGSGQMGIEALSRGAKLAVFVDENKNAQDVIRENLKMTQLTANSRVVAMDAASFLRGTKDKFDIAFLDPPYNKGIINEILPLITDSMSETGIIICEYELGEQIIDEVNDFYKSKDYKYGKTMVSVYKRRS